MEYTAMHCITKFLPKGYSSVGTHINVSHIKATLVNMKVFCEAKIIAVDGRKLTFEVKVYDKEGEIGSGSHTRFIIEEQKFMEKLRKS